MSSCRLLSSTCRGFKQVSRSLQIAARSSRRSNFAVAAAGATAAAAAAAYAYKTRNTTSMLSQYVPLTVQAASPGTPQSNVYSPTKDHALYLWIHLKPDADVKQVAKICGKLQQFVDQVVPPKDKDEDDEILAGIGFGPNFYTQLAGDRPRKNYTYPHRKGANGDMPSTGGEIFIHAKSNQVSSLFHLAQVMNQALKPYLAEKGFNDTYSFVYRNGRDLSGFVDGTENTAAEEDRFRVAVEKDTGGSYCITQRWIHDLDYIAKEKASNLEDFVGRNIADSVELKRKSATSHVARMTSGTGFAATKPVEIVRQSMPYGTVGGEAGLFFIGFAEDPFNFEYMLERMVGATKDGLHDNIMKFSTCVAGSYWYFPSEQELKDITNK